MMHCSNRGSGCAHMQAYTPSNTNTQEPARKRFAIIKARTSNIVFPVSQTKQGRRKL